MNALRPEAMNWTVPPLAVRALRREEGHCASRRLGVREATGAAEGAAEGAARARRCSLGLRDPVVVGVVRVEVELEECFELSELNLTRWLRDGSRPRLLQRSPPPWG